MGSSLILLLVVMVVLAVLAATAVVVMADTQTGTYRARTRMTAFDYAQAALRSGLLAAETYGWPSSSSTYTSAQLTAAYTATYPSGPTPTVQVYDNRSSVNKSITWDQGSPTSNTTPDGQLWAPRCR